MANILNLSGFTFTDEQLRQLNDLLMLEYVKGGPVGTFHNIITGIVSGKKIGWVGEMPTVGKASRGCTPAEDGVVIPVVEKTWSPAEWDILLKQCAADLESTLGVYSRKNNSDAYDLTGTDYERFISEKMGEAIVKAIWRIVWLGDTDAANFNDSPAGEITNGVDTEFFNIIDGLWKQIYAIVAGTAARRVTVAANAQATYALQDSAFTPALAFGYLQQLKYTAHPALKQKSDLTVLATRSFVDKAEQYLMSLNIVPTYENLIEGVPALKINGIPVQPIDIWDEQIRAYQDNGTAYIRPHRALLTTIDNLFVGFPTVEGLGNINVWYEKKERANYFEMISKIDAKIAQNNLIQVAY